MSKIDLDENHMGLGPQSKGDSVFARRMRLHQSWYRAEVLRLPYGTGPQPKSTRYYGNMLTESDAEAGKNFLNKEIHEVAKCRVNRGAGAVEKHRLMRNMLSSQPMCFNLFGPMVKDLDLATLLARALWGHHIDRVTQVAIEWAPQPQHEYLGDRTAFDAFIEYERKDGACGFVGIETKLSEPFSRKHYNKPTYRCWMKEDSPWRQDSADKVDLVVHNQLWRDHLLAWSMLRHASSKYEEGSLAVVYHPEDKKCVHTLEGYRALLSDSGTLVDFDLASVITAWKPLVEGGSWLSDFELRYLALDRSEALGRTRTQSN